MEKVEYNTTLEKYNKYNYFLNRSVTENNYVSMI